MRLSGRGAISFIGIVALGGCFAPMSTREAQTIASQRLTKYCNARCGGFTLAKTQKIRDRWLVDFDAPRHTFTVTVEGNGNASVDVWNKK
ncbi:MAG: hypothetical protein V4601_09400 [Pseudomonadota bacterium]